MGDSRADIFRKFAGVDAPKVLKVYGMDIDGKRRGIIATTSWVNAAKAFGLPVGRARKYGSVTGNPKELAIAMAEPEQPFVTDVNEREYTRYS